MSKRTSTKLVAQSLWDLLPEEIQQAILYRANVLVSADELKARLRYRANHIKRWFDREKGALTLRQRAKGFGKRIRYFASMIVGRSNDSLHYSHYLPLEIGVGYTPTFVYRLKVAGSHYRGSYPIDIAQSTHNGPRNVDALVVSSLRDIAHSVEHFVDRRHRHIPGLWDERDFLKQCLIEDGNSRRWRLEHKKREISDLDARASKFCRLN